MNHFSTTRCKKFSVNFGDIIFPHDLMYIDDGDNNSNNNDDDDDEYNSNNPETHEDHQHHSNKGSTLTLTPSLLIIGSIMLTVKQLMA